MSQIEMGNDEFILYVRKRGGGQGVPNNQLGKQIWIWIRDNIPGSKPIGEQPCDWGKVAPGVAPDALPKTATQFAFERSRLPDLYTFLDTL